MHMLVLTAFSVLLSQSRALRCYECYVMSTNPYKFNDNTSVNLCDQFDYSEKFVTECANSTFCRKTLYEGNIGARLLRVERGCASQLYFGMRYENHIYYDVHRIVRDAYNSGCSTIETYGEKTVNVENCYCDTDLCNQASGIQENVLLIVSFVLYVVMFKTNV